MMIFEVMNIENIKHDMFKRHHDGPNRGPLFVRCLEGETDRCTDGRDKIPQFYRTSPPSGPLPKKEKKMRGKIRIGCGCFLLSVSLKALL